MSWIVIAWNLLLACIAGGLLLVASRTESSARQNRELACAAIGVLIGAGIELLVVIRHPPADFNEVLWVFVPLLITFPGSMAVLLFAAQNLRAQKTHSDGEGHGERR
jgi:hypothetical protein